MPYIDISGFPFEFLRYWTAEALSPHSSSDTTPHAQWTDAGHHLFGTAKLETGKTKLSPGLHYTVVARPRTPGTSMGSFLPSLKRNMTYYVTVGCSAAERSHTCRFYKAPSYRVLQPRRITALGLSHCSSGPGFSAYTRSREIQKEMKTAQTPLTSHTLPCRTPPSRRP